MILFIILVKLYDKTDSVIVFLTPKWCNGGTKKLKFLIIQE